MAVPACGCCGGGVMRGRGFFLLGVGFALGATALGLLGVAKDWTHMVQAMLGLMILGLVPMLIGAVLMVLDAHRWAEDKVASMSDAEVEAMIGDE